MPEYPDITIYIERLTYFLQGQKLVNVRIVYPFVLRTFEPLLESIDGKQVLGFQRLGKRIIFIFTDEYYLVLHLMISCRFLWRER